MSIFQPLTRTHICRLREGEESRCRRRRLDILFTELAVFFEGIRCCTIRMEYRCLKLHLWRKKRVGFRERQSSSKEATCNTSSQRTVNLLVSGLLTSIVSTVIIDHQHDFPFKDIAPNQAAADAWNVLVALHLFELTAE